MNWTSLGYAVAEPLLAPGNFIFDHMETSNDGARDLVRMLVNTLVWMVVAVSTLLAARGVA